MATCLMANRFSMQIDAFDDFSMPKNIARSLFAQPWMCASSTFIEVFLVLFFLAKPRWMWRDEA